MADTDTLATVPLFASLDNAQLSEIARWFDGSAVVANDDAPVAELGPGDFLGEGSLLGGGRRGATITTTSPSRVLVMFGTEFGRLQQAQPAIAAAIEDADRQRHIARS